MKKLLSFGAIHNYPEFIQSTLSPYVVLHSVQKSYCRLDAEVIVVDNNSQDESAAMSENFPEVKLIENSVNSGFSKGNNLGVAQAKGKYICLLNQIP